MRSDLMTVGNGQQISILCLIPQCFHLKGCKMIQISYK